MNGVSSFLYGRLWKRLSFIPMWNKASLQNPESSCKAALHPLGAAEAHEEGVQAARSQPGETSSVNTTQGERVGRKGMEKRFCIAFSLLCLDWKPLSPWPSRRPSDHLEIVPSSFLYRGEAGTVCYGQCQGARQPTGRKVLFLKKAPNPP